MAFNMNFNMNMYGILYRNFNNDKIKQAKEKLALNNLKIEDVLNEQELVNSFKMNTVCQLKGILTKENIIKLIDNVSTFPEDDSLAKGYKYPFFSCEILSSDNSAIIDKFFEDTNQYEKSKYNFIKEDENDESIKIDKFYSNSEGNKKLSLKKLEVNLDVNENSNKTNSRNNTNDKKNKTEKKKEVKKIKEKLLGETGSSDGNEASETPIVKDRYQEFAEANNIEIENNNDETSKTNGDSLDKNSDLQLIEFEDKKIEVISIDIKKKKKDSEENESTANKANDTESNNVIDKEINIDDEDKENSIPQANDGNRVTQTIEFEEANKDFISNKTIDIDTNDDIDNVKDNNYNKEKQKHDNELHLEDINLQETNEKDNLKNQSEPSIESPRDYYEDKTDSLKNHNSDVSLHEIEDENSSKFTLLDYFFNFIRSDQDLDHVLCGYFAKIFNNFFTNKTVILVKYLFERPDLILCMVNHFNRISIIDCLIKLIKYDTDSIILFDRKSCDEVKEEVFKEIFDFIDNKVFNLEENPESEILHCITEFFLECLEDKRTFIFFIKCPKFSLKLFETFLHPCLSKQIFVIARYLEKVYTELTYKPNKQQENTRSRGLSFKGETTNNFSLEKDEDNSLECYYFSELFTSMIDYLFTRFKDESYGIYSYSDKEMHNTYGEVQKKLGLAKLYIMTLFYQILRHTFFVHENRYFNYEEDFFIEFYEKIINSDFFSTAVKYFFEFPWNNMYQNVFLDIINEIIVFSHFNRTLVEHVLYEIGFLEEIILCVIDEKYSCISKFQFKGCEIQNGFLPFIIEIAYNVKLYSYNNPVLLNIIDKSKFTIFNLISLYFYS